MGFDMGFCKEKYDEHKVDGYTYYATAAGWGVRDLALVVARLGVPTGPDYEVEFEIDVKDLAFFKKLHEKIQGHPLFKIVEEVGWIDEETAYQLMDSFPPVVVASLALCFKLDFGNDPKAEIKEDICYELWGEYKDYVGYSMSIIKDFADGYEKMIADGVEKVYFFMSY